MLPAQLSWTPRAQRPRGRTETAFRSARSPAPPFPACLPGAPSLRPCRPGRVDPRRRRGKEPHSPASGRRRCRFSSRRRPVLRGVPHISVPSRVQRRPRHGNPVRRLRTHPLRTERAGPDAWAPPRGRREPPSWQGRTPAEGMPAVPGALHVQRPGVPTGPPRPADRLPGPAPRSGVGVGVLDGHEPCRRRPHPPVLTSSPRTERNRSFAPLSSPRSDTDAPRPRRCRRLPPQLTSETDKEAEECTQGPV